MCCRRSPTCRLPNLFVEGAGIYGRALADDDDPAAGKPIAPAKIFIYGVGVAGSAGHCDGAPPSVLSPGDRVRPATKEQVASWREVHCG